MGKISTGWSDRVREFARLEYVAPARGHVSTIQIPIRDLKPKLIAIGFPGRNANQVVSPLESEKFWKPLGLELCSPKNQSRSKETVLEFRFTGAVPDDRKAAKERALAAAERLRGSMRDEIAAFGGAEAFIRWVRDGDDEQGGESQ